MNTKPTWQIHLVNDEVCECCGEKSEDFYPYMCDAHTVGLDEYGSPELQIVLLMDPEIIGYTLNTIGEMIRDGFRLEDGAEITGIFQGDVSIRTFFTEDRDGETVCRLIFPDPELKFPEDSEEYPYNMQYKSPYKESRMYS